MASTEEQQILDIKVKYEDAIYGIMRYKEKIDELKASLKDLKQQEKDKTITTNEMKVQTEAIAATMKDYQSTVRSLQKELQNNIKQEREQEGSLQQLRAELSNTTKAYDQLSRSERNGAKGKEMQNHINEITQELKSAEEETQRFYRNVGNYEGAINEAIFGNSKFGQSLQAIINMSKESGGVLEGLKSKVSAFGATLTDMFANPYFLAMAGVAGAGMAFKWFYDYNQGIEEATRLTREFTGYTGEVLETTRNSIQATADTFGHDYADVLSTVDALMSQYHLTAEAATKVVNDGFISGADLSGDMLQKIQQYAPTFHDAGVSADQLVAILQQTRSGIFSDKGMDIITMASKKIREMSTGTASALDAIGISSKKVQEDLQNGSKSTFDVIQEISAKLKTLPDDSQQVGEVLKDVFGKQGAGAGLQLIEQLDTMTTKLEEVKKTTGEYGKIQEEQLELNNQLNSLLSSMFDMSQEGWGEMIANAKMFGTKVLIQVLDGLRKTLNWCIQLYNESTVIRAGIVAITTQFKFLWNAIKLVVNLVIDGFKSMGRAVKGLLDILQGIITFDLGKAQQGFQELVSNYSKTVKEGWKDIKDAGKSYADNFVDGWNEVMNGHKSPLKIAKAEGGQTSAAPTKAESNGTPGNKNTAAKSNTAAQKRVAAEAKVTADARKKEQEEVKKAQELLLQLVEDGADKARQIIINKYDQRINAIKTKLQTETNLTANAQKAMNTQIAALEQLKQKELSNFDQEELNKKIEFENKKISLILATIQKGNEQERDLKIKQLDNQEQLDIAQATKNYTDEEQRQEMILAIKKSYAYKRDQVEAEYYNSNLTQQQEAIKQRYENQIAATTNELEQERLKLDQLQAMRDAMRQQDGESDEAYAQRRLEIDQQITNQQNSLAQKRKDVQISAYSTIGDAIGTLSQAASTAGQNDKALAKLSKVLALAQIAINIGVAISKMVTAEAGKGIAGIATTAAGIASIMAQMASAISLVKSAKFAEGGLVTGPGTGTSDSIPAQLSNGESVMTAKATSMFSPILSTFNQLGGGVPIVTSGGSSQMGEDMLAAAIAKGFMMAPAPVVSVEEITDTQRRVQTIETISSI